MTRSEAVETVIAMSGGIRHNPGSDNIGNLSSYRFPSLDAADNCKAILDALLPDGATGAVYLDGRLLVDLAFIDRKVSA